ncbi:MAG: hypothetical protein LBN04_06400 [Oscillospiraceae bacterium]|nr:hypothetical protein [Oscillospiraceae bacterium]
MFDILLWPFRLIFSLVGLVFDLIGSVFSLVFGLVGGFFGFVFGGLFWLLAIVGVVALVRWVRGRQEI